MELSRRIVIFFLAALITLFVLVAVTSMWPRPAGATTAPDVQVESGRTLYTLIVVRCEFAEPGSIGCIADAAPVFWATLDKCEEIASGAKRTMGGPRVLLIEAKCMSFTEPAF